MVVEVEVNGVKYRTGKLNGFEQAHLVKRIGLLFSGMGQSFSRFPTLPPVNGQEPNENAAGDETPPVDPASFFEGVGPILEALQKIPDEDLDYVFKLCLGKCQRHNGTNWGPVMGQGQLMFPDELDLPQMVQLTFAVVSDNLGSFFPAPRPQSSAGVAG